MSFLNSTSFLDFIVAPAVAVKAKISKVAMSISEKIANNIEALKIIKDVQASPRTELTDQEFECLTAYTGWGQLSGLFEQEHPRNAELRAMLTAAEYRAIEGSILTSYYTADWLIDAMYRACNRLGVHEGRLLDPSTGSGRFLNRLPATMANMRPVGIELDSMTGTVARLLNPGMKIYVNQPFETVKLPASGDYSLVISNPPYSSVSALDTQFGKLNLHNYFMLRGIQELHTGGLMAYVVSAWVMDSKDDYVRRELACFANLVAACRLPNSIFAGEGANVVTDILIFQSTGNPVASPIWTETVELQDDAGATYRVNRLFAERPELVAGSISAPTTYTRSCEVSAPAGELLEDAVNRILDQQTQSPVFFRDQVQLQARRGSVVAPAGIDNIGPYEFALSANGELIRRIDDETDENGIRVHSFELVEPTRKNDRLRIVAMLRVKAALGALLASEKADDAANVIQGHRANLNASYDAFTADFGPFHSTANKRALSADPWYYRLRALELDYTSPISKTVAEREGVEARAEKWEKGALFTRRIIKPVTVPTTAANLAEAVLLSVSFKACVDAAYIRKLVNYTGTEAELIAELADQGLAFVDPVTDELVYGRKYLSGFVRAKLAEAEERALQEPEFANNVRHLTAVQPATIPAVDVFVPLNATWLPTSVHEGFVRHLARNESLNVRICYVLGKFECQFFGLDYMTETSVWGTLRRPMSHLLDSLLNNGPIKVEDRTDDGALVVNEEETLAAQHKADAIRAEWVNWVHDSAERREVIEQTYNDKFNGFVAPSYDGSHLTFQGCSVNLYSTQKNVVMRGLMERALLIDHAVGAGKTNSMIALAQTLRAINAGERIMLVAPNHLISQHAAAAQVLFPGLDVFVLDKKMMEPATRRAALARLSLCDFDLCIVPLSVFGLIPAPADLLVKMVEEEIAALCAALSELETKKMSVRDIVKRIKKKEADLAEITRKHKDQYLDFADLRMSTLIVDESQFGKNLAYATSLTGVAGMGDANGSKRAFDLYVKSRFVQDQGGRYVEATGTPILNSIVECHRHLRVFAREYTQQVGLTHFDAFSSVFAQPVTDYEMAPSGRGYKLRTRISQFTNVTELQSIYSSFADVVIQEQLPTVLPRLADGRSAIPRLAGGKIKELVIEPNVYQEEGFKDIVHRFQNTDRHNNNPLKLMHMGRQLSMDARLVYPHLPDVAGSKINVVADYLVGKYQATTGVKGTQLVFMDRSIPARHRANANKEWLAKLELVKSGDEEANAELEGMDWEAVETMLNSTFSLYDELVEKLICRGIPAEEIAVIHDYRTDARKEMLREKMNRGEIRILIGSTELMGSGMNVNKRLVSLVDFDLPLRPGDLIQRHGRIERQGNELWRDDPTFEIEIVVPLTGRTLDAWQLGLLNTKQSFITRFRQLDSSVRHYTERQEVIDFAELSAIVADDPRILQHVKGKAQLRKLEVLKNHWFRNRAMLQDDQLHKANRKANLIRTLPDAEDDAAMVSGQPQGFTMKVGSSVYVKRGFISDDTDPQAPAETAAQALLQRIRALRNVSAGTHELAEYKGCKLILERERYARSCQSTTSYTVVAKGSYDLSRFIKTDSINGIINAFERLVDNIPNLPSFIAQRIEKTEHEIQAAQVEINKPFEQQDELDQLVTTLQALEKELAQERMNNRQEKEQDTQNAESEAAIAA